MVTIHEFRGGAIVGPQGLREQAGAGARTDRENEPRRAARPLGMPHRGVQATEQTAALVEEDNARRGELHVAAGALQKPHSYAALQPGHRPRQRRLSDAQPLRRPAEVQFLSNGDEIDELPGLQTIHTLRISLPTGTVIAPGAAPLV